MTLTREQTERYSRHILLPDVGVEGQEKLMSARVLIVGAGGLGAPVSIYLAAAGIGDIGIVEFDRVDLSNLQRQILYDTKSIGLPKAEVAERRLKMLNPEVNIITYNEPLTEKTALDLFDDFDLIVDATDNFATRYLINDASVILGKTYIYGSIFDYEGQITVLGAKGYPCYRCLFPQPPEKKSIPGCTDKGVFGLLPGVVGSIQATEALKQILGIGSPLLGRLLIYDCLEMTMAEMRIQRDKNCPMCGDKAIFKELSGYDAIKGIEPETDDSVERVTIDNFLYEANGSGSVIVLDVRDFYERDKLLMENTIHLPLSRLKDEIGSISAYRKKNLVVMCQTGVMAMCAARVLLSEGFENVRVLDEGMEGLLASSKREVLKH